MDTKWTATEMVKKSSGGLSYCGIFLSTKEDITFRRRLQVISAPDDLEFSGAYSGEQTFYKDFVEESSSDAFMDKIENFGGRLACNGNVNSFFASANADISASQVKKEKSSQMSTKNTKYASAMRYIKVPVQSVYLDPDSISLKESVQSRLSEIENVLIDENKYSIFRKFFEDFGSHVSVGLIEFGGIMITKSESKTTSGSMKEDANEMVRDAVNAYFDLNINLGADAAGVGLECSADKLKDDNLKKYDKNQLMGVVLTTKKIGGPLDEDDIKEWKKILTKHNTSWRVVEKPNHLIPIWDLIQRHKTNFNNWKMLTCQMEEAWNAIISKENKEKEESNETDIHQLATEFRKLGDKRKEVCSSFFKSISKLTSKGKLGVTKNSQFTYIKSLEDGQIIMSAMKKTQLDPETTLLQYKDIKDMLEEQYTIYLKIEHNGVPLGKLIITLNGKYPRCASHFLELCMGDNTKGRTWIGAEFEKVNAYRGQGERIRCNGYKDENNKLITDPMYKLEEVDISTQRMQGEVRGFASGNQVSGFVIIIKSSAFDNTIDSPVIGHIVSGMDILQIAIARGKSFVAAITISDCGLVVVDTDRESVSGV